MLPERTVHLKTALERQDLSRPYLAHHELENVVIVIINTTIIRRELTGVARTCLLAEYTFSLS